MSKVTYIDKKVMKPVKWLGNSLAQLRKWTKSAKQHAGKELQEVQQNSLPSNWKPMTIVGPGAAEIRLAESDGQYRIIYVAKFTDVVYVLHAIAKKKTQKTAICDIEIAKRNYRDMMIMRRTSSDEKQK